MGAGGSVGGEQEAGVRDEGLVGMDVRDRNTKQEGGQVARGKEAGR